MSENIIESLVVQLGLDASGLNEKAAKDAIGNIKSSVVELNEALKETKDLLGAIGKVTQQKQSSAKSQTAPVQPAVPVAPSAPAAPPSGIPDKEEAAKKRLEAAFLKWKGKQEMKAASALRAVEAQTTSHGVKRIIAGLEDSLANLGTAESSGILSGHQVRVQRGLLKDVLDAAQGKLGVVAKAETDRKSEDDKRDEEDAAASTAEKAERARQRVEREAQRQRDRDAKRKMPTSLGGLLRAIPGLGTIAAGLYIARQAFDAVAGFVGKITETMKGGQDIRTAAQSFGIATDRMQGFTDAAVQFGANSNEIAQDMTKFMSGAQIPIGGQYHWGLARKGVAVSEGGQWRNMEDIMGDLADVMSKEPKLNKDTYNYYRHMFGFSKQTVDFMQQGREGIEKMRQDAINRGMALSGKDVDRQSYQALKWAEYGKGISVALQKASLYISESMVGTEEQHNKWKEGKGASGLMFEKAMQLPLTQFPALFPLLDVLTRPLLRDQSKPTQEVTPSAQSLSTSNGGKQQSPQVTVNVSVDKSGSATTSVKGTDRNNVKTNFIAPYLVRQ